MMAATLIAELEAAGVRLSIRDGALAVKGPRAALTPERVAVIRASRTELLAALTAPAPEIGAREAQCHPVMRVAGAGVIVTGLEPASRHRAIIALASHHRPPVRNVAARHDYAGGVLTLAAENVAVALRVAEVVRRALALAEPNSDNLDKPSARDSIGGNSCDLK